MSELGPHAGYIIASYAGVGLFLLLLIGWVLWDGARVRARLAALEAQGVRRRSAAASSAGSPTP